MGIYLNCLVFSVPRLGFVSSLCYSNVKPTRNTKRETNQIIRQNIFGCAHTTQTTSGEDYLSRYKSEFITSNKTQNKDTTNFKQSLLEAASIEPTLVFPARIGVARIENGDLSLIPQDEIDAWVATHKSLGDNFGTFVPINLLVTNLASTSSQQKVNSVIETIRLGAAKQHLDAVLVYEVRNNTNQNGNFLRLGALTIIGGYFLPSESITAQGYANAILIDVIQGYPYGTAQTTVEQDEIATTWGAQNRIEKIEKEITQLAAIKLTEEVKDMFLKLRYELAESRIE